MSLPRDRVDLIGSGSRSEESPRPAVLRPGASPLSLTLPFSPALNALATAVPAISMAISRLWIRDSFVDIAETHGLDLVAVPLDPKLIMGPKPVISFLTQAS
ncbi:hypothetical protein WOLCODRAFT_153428 [Wolfiporia cocos MD-104 SS10]|uniref:Uncharacterized protein n=1 Tax=Wolfiporia cocos (strain MD-104) TaxID=742152 RepID=A0A2H3JME3_WOLCO|nr:hypothetical protein WOLCODRAFT_153428 [Wolfiporia cocos MD-104 SS10]